ncbi:hypothetical protein KY327_02015 [Candidatus Woesearchaeota archaeon]|nr:hypothetical protein [Candidatus Woesearchaeota archaeon]
MGIDDFIHDHYKDDEHYQHIKRFETFVKDAKLFQQYLDHKEPALHNLSILKALASFDEEYAHLLRGVAITYGNFKPESSEYDNPVEHAYHKLVEDPWAEDFYRGVIKDHRDIKEAVVTANECLNCIDRPLQEWDKTLYDENDVARYVAEAWEQRKKEQGWETPKMTAAVIDDVTEKYHAVMDEHTLTSYLRNTGRDDILHTA